MPLGTEVSLGLGHIVLDGDPAPPGKGARQCPHFDPCLLWPRSSISATAELLLAIVSYKSRAQTIACRSTLYIQTCIRHNRLKAFSLFYRRFPSSKPPPPIVLYLLSCKSSIRFNSYPCRVLSTWNNLSPNETDFSSLTRFELSLTPKQLLRHCKVLF